MAPSQLSDASCVDFYVVNGVDCMENPYFISQSCTGGLFRVFLVVG